MKAKAAIAAGVAVAVAAAYVAWDWTFLHRYATFEGDPMTVSVDWFQPKAPVKGGGDVALPPAPEGMATISADALDDAATFAEAQNSSALIVVRRGRVEFERYWDGANRDTIHNPQSMSKTVLGLTMGAAIADGKIAVDDPMDKYLTEWRGQPRGAITIEQMLWMASGLEHMSDDYQVRLFAKSTRYNFGTDFVGHILGLELEGTPGEKFDYNDDNTNLLGLAIERAVARPYPEYMSEKIWQPVGNADAGMLLDRPGGATMKSCCIFSRPMDWARLGLLVLHRGQVDGKEVVPASWVDAMTTSSPAAAYYGYQVWRAPGNFKNSEEPFLDPEMIYFSGYGFQRVWISRQHDLVIVRFGRKWPAEKWNETKIPNTIIRGIRAGM